MIAMFRKDALIDGHDRWYSLVQAAYVIAGVLFILSLAGLSHQRSAKAGNIAGKIGMVLALAATVALSLLAVRSRTPWITAALIAAALLIGAVIGTAGRAPGRDDPDAAR